MDKAFGHCESMKLTGTSVKRLQNLKPIAVSAERMIEMVLAKRIALSSIAKNNNCQIQKKYFNFLERCN